MARIAVLFAWIRWTMMTVMMLVANPAMAKAGQAKQLPNGLYSHYGSRPPSIEGEDFRLHSIQALDADGKVIDGLPAWLVDVADPYPGNKKFDSMYDAKIPAFKGIIPDELRGKIALYYFYGWKIAPRGWRIRHAVISIDGSDGFAFVSPAGESQGWIDFSWLNGCLGCMDEEADGLIRGAHQTYMRDMQIDDMPSTEPRLSPKPYMLINPDRCSVLFAYRKKKSLPVEATMVTKWSEHELAFVGSVYAALPPVQKSLANFIVEQYRKDRSSCDAPSE